MRKQISNAIIIAMLLALLPMSFDAHANSAKELSSGDFGTYYEDAEEPGDNQEPGEPEVQPPERVVSMKAKLVKYNSIKLEWTDEQEVDGYTVYYKNTTKKNARAKCINCPADKRSYTFKKLAKGKKYKVGVIPYVMSENIKINGNPYYSYVRTIGMASIKKIKKTGYNSIDITWKKAAGVTGYQVSRTTKKKGTKIITTTKSTSLSTVMTADKNYFKVRAYKKVGAKRIYGKWSKVKAFTRNDGDYRIKVNKKKNVVTIYRMTYGKWKPVRAMLCSCGKGGNTPTGTYTIRKKWDWGLMVGGVYARYVSQFYGDFLIHSVPYEVRGDNASMYTKEFNKLGKDASHGCVRLTTGDTKWIYDNCKTGTVIEIYSSDNPGPLGKPKGTKISTKKRLDWDPTNPASGNPYK